MPNHVANIVTFRGNEEKINKMLLDIQNETFGPGSISFDKIIPMPPELNIESGSKSMAGLRLYRDFMDIYSLGHFLSKEEMLAVPDEIEEKYMHIRPDIDKDTWDLGKKAFQNIVKYGAPDWYDWRTNHWNTKWDAYGYTENTDYSQCDKLAFMTAWQEPAPVIQQLSEMYPEVEITHRWAEEQYGHYCGTAKYLGGRQTENELMPENSRSEEFALDLWHQLNTNGTPMDQGQTMQ